MESRSNSGLMNHTKLQEGAKTQRQAGREMVSQGRGIHGLMLLMSFNSICCVQMLMDTFPSQHRFRKAALQASFCQAVPGVLPRTGHVHCLHRL